MREEVLYEVSIDLRKAYDTLNMEHCSEILFSYGIRPRTERILWLYWEQLLMVYQEGCY